MLAPTELRAVHPLGKSPVITDGDITLAESGAIVEYLADRYGAGRLAPAFGSPERVRYLYWLHFAEGTAQPPSLLKLLFDRVKSKAPLLVRPIARAIADKALAGYVLPNIRRNLDFMESDRILAASTFEDGDGRGTSYRRYWQLADIMTETCKRLPLASAEAQWKQLLGSQQLPTPCNTSR